MQINVLEYLENGALAQCADRSAVLQDGSSCTFAALDVLARKCGSAICRKSPKANRPIAVFLPKCIETIAANLGILHSGNCYTNLDVKSPAPRVKSILNNLQPTIVITSREFLPAVSALGIAAERILLVEEFTGDGRVVDDAEIARRRKLAIDTDPVCIINTSGSTGIPKSVVMSHRNIIDFMDWVMERFEFRETDVIGSLSPFYFDIYTLELFVCLAKAAQITIIPDSLATFPVKLVQHLAERGVTFLFWVPSIMVNIANMGLLATADLTQLKTVFFAGEVFPTKQFNYWRRHLPQALFVNLYGPIEITVDCTYFVVGRPFADHEPLPIGSPVGNTDILILNERNEAVADGETGELCVRGTSLAMGYWNDPEKTQAAFAQNPLNANYPERIYRTGDLAYRDARGEIMFVGRKDYQIKHLGYRIELGEIETAVGSIEAINAACVLYNAAKKEITLFFTSSEPINPAIIRQALSQVLPKYMLPTAFHQLEALPRNPNGKIDRHKLMSSFGG
jgi:D-alanine--poly(phosphoribitol) ligase subunit 1